MATLAQQVALSTNRTFSARLQAAGATVALEVLAEPNWIHGNALRRSFATGVLGSPEGFEQRLSIAVLTDDGTYRSQVSNPDAPQAAAPKTDAEADIALLARLREVWSLLAGVPPVPEG